MPVSFDRIIAKAHSFLFLGVIFLIPFQRRFFFESPFSFFKDSFIEYTSFYFSFPELLALAVIVLNLILIARNRSGVMSRNKLALILILVTTLFFNVVKSAQPLLSLHQLSHLLLWTLFSLTSLTYLDSYQKIIRTIQIFIVAAFLESLILILQFTFQHSLGISFLGESVLDPNILGVAKVHLNNRVFIRGYGTEPHPNIAGEYLFLGITLALFYIFNLKRDSFSLKESLSFKICSTWNKFIQWITHLSIVPRGTIERFIPKIISFRKINLFEKEFLILTIFILVLSLALILTFSRAAIFSLFLVIVLIKLFHVEQFKQQKEGIKNLIFISFIGFILIFGGFFFSRFTENCSTWNNSQCQDLTRQSYLELAIPLIKNNLFLGTGSGTFVFNLIQDPALKNLNPWDLQPVHNTLLLVLSDLGLITALIILIFLTQIFIPSKKISYLNPSLLQLSLFIVLFFSLFDHFLYSFSQGQAMLAFFVLIILATQKTNTTLFHVEQCKKYFKTKTPNCSTWNN